jgi:hypothetical protein
MEDLVLPEDLTAVSQAEYLDWSPELVKYALYRVGTTPDECTVPRVMHRMREFIHLNSLNSSPVSVSRLNRQFGRVARKAGTSCKALTDVLVAKRQVELFERHGRRALLSAQAWTERQALMAENEIMPYSPAFDAAMDALAENII